VEFEFKVGEACDIEVVVFDLCGCRDQGLGSCSLRLSRGLAGWRDATPFGVHDVSVGDGFIRLQLSILTNNHNRFAQALALTMGVFSGYLNIFRILGDLSHVASIFILIWAIHRNRSAEGTASAC
jgi:hypothetical protein